MPMNLHIKTNMYSYKILTQLFFKSANFTQIMNLNICMPFVKISLYKRGKKVKTQSVLSLVPKYIGLISNKFQISIWAHKKLIPNPKHI